MLKEIKNAGNLLMYLPLLGIFFVAWIANPITSIAEAGVTYYVSPDGINTNSGTSLLLPFKTIQRAVDMAQPGDVINLSSGEYRGDIVSRRDGTADNHITILGPADAIVRGGGNSRVIEINHNYYTLNGFTVDGLYGSPTKSSGYRDSLIYVLGKGVRQGVEGLKITNMTLKNSGGECLRLRYFATKAEIAYNTITNCGVQAFVFNAGGKNGEGIYVGTSNKQWGDGKNPTNDPDETRDNLIHHNYIDTQGNECVDIKEGATANIIEYNTCRGQKDSESGGFDSRGDGNVFRYNDVRGSIGGGVRLGGASVNGRQYGKNNDVYGNTIVDNKNGGIKFQVAPQGKICGNSMSGNTGGDSTGDFSAEFDPTLSCEKGAAPTPPDTTPPTVTITAPIDGTVVSGTINIIATATDNVAVASITFQVDGKNIGSEDTSAPYQTSLNTETLVNGVHTLRATARDTGNQTSNNAITTTVNNQTTETTTGPIHTNSLARNETLIAHSNNFSDGYGPPKLWDGCYEDSSYNSNTCTAGGRDIPSFWLEFDFGKLYEVSQIRLYGDTEGDWVSKKWALKYKGNSFDDTWTVAFSDKNAFVSGWLTEPLSVKARYMRVEISGDDANFSPGRTQARELEIYGTEAAIIPPSPPIAPAHPTTPPPSSGGGGGGSTGVAPQPPNSTTTPPNPTTTPSALKPVSRAQIVLLIKPLYQGVHSEETRRLQTFLSQDTSLYPEALVTGYFGLLTRKAIQRFQCRHNIVCAGDESTTGYGQVGSKTLTKLNELMYSQNRSMPPVQIQSFTQKLFFGSQNGEVRRLQEFLAKDVSVYPERLVTGYFGLLTRKAVQRFQCKYGIICDGDEHKTGYGQIGPRTLQKLNLLR